MEGSHVKDIPGLYRLRLGPIIAKMKSSSKKKPKMAATPQDRYCVSPKCAKAQVATWKHSHPRMLNPS
jgi:hypothetical protein